jgi:hypothetical protein
MYLGRLAQGSSSGLRGHRRTYLTILERAWSANLKMVWYVLLRPLRPEIDGQDPFQNIWLLRQTRKTPTLVNPRKKWLELIVAKTKKRC